MRQIGDDSTFIDKLKMLGIVEGVFGGPPDHYSEIAKENVISPSVIHKI